MLPAWDGEPMIKWAISSINYKPEDLVITVLKEHDEKFGVIKGLRNVFPEGVTVVCLEHRTKSQAETIVKTLQELRFEGSFLVKDSDNIFELKEVEKEYNYVCVDSLNNHDEINPRNKSYVSVDHTGRIINIREKSVISDLFNVGGYFFRSSVEFISSYEALSSGRSEREIYISDVIGRLISEAHPFFTQLVSGYHDWGTILEWRKFLRQRSAAFISVDGFLFERGFEHFLPTYTEVKSNANAIRAVQELAKRGGLVIYLSVRPEALRAQTELQLKDAGLPTGQLLMECPHGRWNFIGAPHPVLPHSGFAILECEPNDPALIERVALL
jgi:hypothetical protein